MTNLEMLKNAIDKATKEKDEFEVLEGVKMDKTCSILIHKGNAYRIDIKEDVIVSCSCPHHTYRHGVCKHMIYMSEKYNFNIHALG
ncbi:hypothetical protein D3C81_11260 [compost metagenome]